MQGHKVGYQWMRVQPSKEQGPSLVRIDGGIVMRVRRGRDQVEQRIELSSVETTQGEMIEFASRLEGGPAPQVVRVRVEGDMATVESSTAGQPAGEKGRQSIAWPREIKGFAAVELDLAENPMRPGEKRSMKTFMPIINQPADVQLTARDLEPTKVLGGTLELLRIDVQVRLPTQEMPPATIWIDHAGEQIKTAQEVLGQETFRTTKEVATSENEPVDFDINAQTLVRLDQPLSHPHRLKRVRYRVTLDGGDPVAAFVSGPSQQVERIDDETAEVTVLAIRPGSESFAGDAAEASSADLAASPLIQSDDALIVAMAQEAAGDEADPWKTMLALETFVRSTIRRKNYSTAFATAAEVARSKEGDCTEHAVLLSALARARKIPARVAMGLVYVEAEQAFLYHMWTEALIAGVWIPLDATLGQGGIGGGHLKLAQSNLQGGSAFSSFLPIAQVLGRLKIDVLAVE